MKKKLLAFLVGLAILCLCAAAGAEIISGDCAFFYGGGGTLTYTLDTATGVLTIHGTGGWGDYPGWMGPPYDTDYAGIGDGNHGSSVKSVVIESGVTSIAGYAFRGFQNLASVTIPETVTTISEAAFKNCTSLTSVVLPSGITKIGASAFEGCTSLSSINFPEALQSIGDKAFYKCKSLRTVTTYGDLGESVFQESGITAATVKNCSKMGESVFYDCDNLMTAAIEEGITDVPRSTFNNCAILREVKLPESVLTIGYRAFRDSPNLANVNMPSNLLTISEEAFYASGLTSVVIPDTVTSMGISAFDRCEKLTSATVSKGLGTIPDYTFWGCSSLMKVTIPEGPQIIGKGVFKKCALLQTAAIPSTVVTLGDEAFRECSSLTSVSLPSSVQNLGSYVFSYCPKLLSLELPSGLMIIPEGCFSDSGIKAVAIPSSVISVNKNAFSYARQLTDVFYSGSESDKSGISIDTNGNSCLTSAIWHCNEASFGNLNPGQIWTITYTWADDHSSVTATAVCGNKSDHIITETVNAQGRQVQAPGCETVGKMTYTSENFEGILFTFQTIDVEIPATGHNWGETNYNWEYDEKYEQRYYTAHRTCRNDSSHTEEETVTVAPKYDEPTVSSPGYTTYTAVFTNPAFETQTDSWEWWDTDFTLGGIKYHMSYVYDNSSRNARGTLRSATKNPVASEYEVYAVGAEKKNVTKLDIPATVTMYGTTFKVIEIDDNAFAGLKKLKTVTIGKNIREIGDNAFKNCTALTTVTIGAKVKSIEESAFAGCKKLATVKGGAAVTEIEASAFSGDKALKTFPAMGKLQTIGFSAFKGCAKLAQFTLGASVKSIGKDAFNGCSSLKKITVKTTKLTTKNVYANAFKGIAKKAAFTVPKAKLKAYKTLFVKRGAAKTCTFASK